MLPPFLPLLAGFDRKYHIPHYLCHARPGFRWFFRTEQTNGVDLLSRPFGRQFKEDRRRLAAKLAGLVVRPAGAKASVGFIVTPVAGAVGLHKMFCRRLEGSGAKMHVRLAVSALCKSRCWVPRPYVSPKWRYGDHHPKPVAGPVPPGAPNR